MRVHNYYRKWRSDLGCIRHLIVSKNLVFVCAFEPGHYYSPLPDLAEVEKNAAAIFDTTAKDLDGIVMNECGQLQLAEDFAKLYAEIPFGKCQTEECRYFFDNPYFCYGDGVILYSFMRRFLPKKIIEVGSGYSSAAMLDINERFFERSIHFTFIEPFPKRLLGLIAQNDRNFLRLEEKSIQLMNPAVFSSLEANDILFVDSSHVGKIGSDVLHILFEVLPILRPGVIIHFHDVLWPFEYPRHWVEAGRAWNEAYYLRAFLQYNANYEILFFNSFMGMHHRETMTRLLPLFAEDPSRPETEAKTSLWLRKIV